MSCWRAPEQYATAFEKAGIAGTPELASFIATAESTGGVPALIKARLKGAALLDFSGCAQGAGLVALGAAQIALAASTGGGSDAAIALGATGVALAQQGMQLDGPAVLTVIAREVTRRRPRCRRRPR